MELDAVVGAVIELGERLGIGMPATRAVYACATLVNEHIVGAPKVPGVPEVPGVLS
jgi:hypothetical protein